MALGMATVAYELRFDAGRISLDLLATTHPEERLDSTEVLCAWIVGSGLVPDGTDLTHADPSWLVGFRELRGRIGQLVRGAPGPGYDLALAHVNDVARAAPPAPARCGTRTARWCVSWTVRPAVRHCSGPSPGTP